MRPFFAIVKLTWRNAVRSHVFQLLLVALLLAVAIIPTTVRGSVNAGDFLRISLLYSMSAISGVLALSSLWLGCSSLTQDIESSQLHMLVSKPVSRVTIWLAKWTGVCVINLVLLFVASAITCGVIVWNFDRQNFAKAELDKARAEIMTGRRVYLPEQPDFDELARAMVKRRVEVLRSTGSEVDVSPEKQNELLREARRVAVSRSSELPAGGGREWKFKNLPKKVSQPIFLRYRAYIGDKADSRNQRMTRALWNVGVPRKREAAAATVGDARDFDVYYYSLTAAPEQVMSGIFHEKRLEPEWGVITPEQEIFVRYFNADESKSAQYFQSSDGPKLLIEVTSFEMNYLRATLIVALELVILAGLGCAFGGFMSLPTAIFTAVSYLLFGSLSTYILGQSYIAGAGDLISRYISTGLLKVVIPLQVFDVTSMVSDGELVEFSYMGELLYIYAPRALVLFALGIWLYRKRELGLVGRR